MAWLPTLALLAFTLLLPAAPVRAEDYILGPDDVIAISVWLHPELERTVAVSATGSIVFPPVGEVTAAGLTPKQLGERLADKVTSYLRQAATVTVTVRDFLSHSIFVTGAVARPGRYGFEHIPSVIDVLSAAGGALTGSDLSRVQVVRQDGDQRHTLIADVASVLRDGSVQNLPKLKAGDTVMVPALQGGTVAAGTDGASVLGEVGRPGIYPAAGGQDLWAILATAGGLTARADLKNIKIVTHERDATAIIQVDLANTLKRAPHMPMVIKPGDVVYVPSTAASTYGQAVTAFAASLQVALAVLNVAVLVAVLQHGGHY